MAALSIPGLQKYAAGSGEFVSNKPSYLVCHFRQLTFHTPSPVVYFLQGGRIWKSFQSDLSYQWIFTAFLQLRTFLLQSCILRLYVPNSVSSQSSTSHCLFSVTPIGYLCFLWQGLILLRQAILSAEDAYLCFSLPECLLQRSLAAIPLKISYTLSMWITSCFPSAFHFGWHQQMLFPFV